MDRAFNIKKKPLQTRNLIMFAKNIFFLQKPVMNVSILCISLKTAIFSISHFWNSILPNDQQPRQNCYLVTIKRSHVSYSVI